MNFSSLFGGGSDKPKASIYCLDNADWNVVADFNPTSFKYTRATEWALEQSIAMGHAWQRMAFKTGKVDELEVTLLFDESEDRSETKAADFMPSPANLVRSGLQSQLPESMQPTPSDRTALDKVTQLHRLTLPFNFGSDSEPQIRPPAVAFVWGPFEFQGFITSLTNEFLLFDEEGGVRRVQSSLKLQGRAMGAASDVDSLLDGDYTPGKQSASGNAGSKTSASRKDILASLLK